MNYIWELIVNILESFVFFIFVNGKLPKKELRHTYLKQAFVSLLLSGLVLFCNIYNISPIITMLALLFLHYIYTCIFFSSSHIVNLFWVIVFCIAAISADAIMTIIPTNLFHINITSALVGGSLRIPFTILYITLLTIIILTLLCFSSKTLKLNLSEKLGFIFLSIVCISIEDLIVISQSQTYIKNSTTYIHLLYVVFFLVLILFIALAIYLYHLGLEKEKNIQLSNLHILSEMERKQYEQIISSISELRYMKHDINNHIETLSSLMLNKKYTEATDFLHDLSTSVNDNHYILASGNSTIDSIITNKLFQCRALSINVNYSVYLTKSIPLTNIELCSLLGNLFDNAIEASKLISNQDNRIIDFSMKPYQDMLSIVIINKTNGKYKMDKSKHFLSSKNTTFTPYHGLGLSRIVNIIETHDGIIDIIPTDSEFTVSILIPLILNGKD